MATWNIPPKAKVYEALSAVGDGRIEMSDMGRFAKVQSSDGKKTYIVEWDANVTQIASNDNASYWQGYTGYPIIAVLMKLGKLTYSEEIANHLSGIPWKEINKQFKNDWDKAVDHAMDALGTSKISRKQIDEEVDKIFQQIEQLDLERMRTARKPPK